MPDATRKTISATEAPGLFGVSPYVTRWMLYQRFARNIDLSIEPNSRMEWGKKLQPLVLAQAAADLRLTVIPNASDLYVRRGLLGCTVDATILCPDRGPGALETKCVFDYRDWMTDWKGGDGAPRHHEIQLQQQMYVGNGTEPFKWGVIGLWLAGDMHYFERKPIEKLWKKLEQGATEFFDDLKAGKEPDPFGTPIELPWMTQLLPTVEKKIIDLSGDIEAEKHAENVRLYQMAKDQENGGKREAEALRAKLLALAKDAEQVLLPAGIKITIGGNEKSKRLSVYVPDDVSGPIGRASMPADILSAG